MGVASKLLKIPIALRQRCSRKFSFLRDFTRSRWVFWPALVIPAIALLVLVIILPLHQFKRELHRTPPGIPHQFLPIDADSTDFPELNRFSSQLLQLKLDELFFNSQLIMAKTDSIGLILNLVDSTISLSLRGVSIRSCPISSYKMSRGFHHLKREPHLFQWLSRPFTLKEDWATIPKVPITVRKAPRDTIEAQKYKIQPAAPARPDVYFTLQFDRNLIIKVHQTEPIAPRGWLRIAFYYLKSYAKLIAATFEHFYHLKLPEHCYSIEISIAKNDATAIYRALPLHAELVPRLPIER